MIIRLFVLFIFINQSLVSQPSYDVLIEIGQSNSGSRDCTDLSLLADINTRIYNVIWPNKIIDTCAKPGYNTGFFGFPDNYSLGLELANKMNKINPTLLFKMSVGGTALCQNNLLDWNINSTGELFEKFKAEYAVFNQKYKVKNVYILFMQGESDVVLNCENQYYYNLNSFYNSLQNITNAKRWVITTLSPGQTNNPEGVNSIRNSQYLLSSNKINVSLIDMLNVPLVDLFHYDCNALIALSNEILLKIHKRI